MLADREIRNLLAHINLLYPINIIFLLFLLFTAALLSSGDRPPELIEHELYFLLCFRGGRDHHITLILRHLRALNPCVPTHMLLLRRRPLLSMIRVTGRVLIILLHTRLVFISGHIRLLFLYRLVLQIHLKSTTLLVSYRTFLFGRDI